MRSWRQRGLLLPAARTAAWAAALAAGCLWAYWPTLGALAHRWAVDPQYSHGYLVPAFALLLLWLRRAQLTSPARPSAWGAAFLAAGTALRLAGACLYFDWLDAVSLLPCLAGAALLLGGWPALRWSWPAVAFLAFMIPLPYQVELALAHPLQRVAAVASTYCLQTCGYPALAEGNVITIGTLKVGVAEACSGLSMLVVFIALSFALCLALARPLWQKAFLVVSAVPVAVVANVLRITVTGVLFETAGKGVANMVYHDLAGWLMIPVALALLALELCFLKYLVVEVPAAGAGPIALTGPAAPTRARYPVALPDHEPGRPGAVPVGPVR
jgi:exosortase